MLPIARLKMVHTCGRNDSATDAAPACPKPLLEIPTWCKLGSRAICADSARNLSAGGMGSPKLKAAFNCPAKSRDPSVTQERSMAGCSDSGTWGKRSRKGKCDLLKTLEITAA